MLNKTLLASPVTQGREAVKQLIAYHNHGVEPQEMPDFYRLTGEMVLALNNKKDAYYVTTPKTCSCPAAVYNPGPCKHARKYFPPAMREAATKESIRPKLPAFKPFDRLPSEEKAAAGVA
ncbi:MAG: SWIM zinc finger family protein [Methanothrix sp.]